MRSIPWEKSALSDSGEERAKFLGGVISVLSGFVWNGAEVIYSPLSCSTREHKPTQLAGTANIP